MIEAKPIAAPHVLYMLRSVNPYSPHAPAFPEIAFAIAEASNHDPLWPSHADGCERTAALLVAAAWHQSKFHPNIVTPQGLGLFKIRPPNANIDGKLLLIPYNAAHVAIDLIRTGLLRGEAFVQTARSLVPRTLLELTP